jgi:hypothetical protein
MRLLDARKALNGKAGFKVMPNRNQNEGGLVVEMKAGNAMPRNAWVGMVPQLRQ